MFEKFRKSREEEEIRFGRAPVIEETPSEPEAAPMPEPETKSSIEGSNIELKVVRPESVDEIFTIADYLIEGCTVVLNLELLESVEITRMLDFLNGVTYVTEGTITQRSQKSFVITPKNVSITD